VIGDSPCPEKSCPVARLGAVAQDHDRGLGRDDGVTKLFHHSGSVEVRQVVIDDYHSQVTVGCRLQAGLPTLDDEKLHILPTAGDSCEADSAIAVSADVEQRPVRSGLP
jgi:hypothetical protein